MNFTGFPSGLHLRGFLAGHIQCVSRELVAANRTCHHVTDGDEVSVAMERRSIFACPIAIHPNLTAADNAIWDRFGVDRS